MRSSSHAVKYSKDEAFHRYRNNPARFWDEYLKNNFSHLELISPQWNHSMMKYHYNLMENAIIESLDFNMLKNKSVLDIGCGTGWWFEFFRFCLGAKTYVGIDVSKTSINKLRKQYHKVQHAKFELFDIGTRVLSSVHRKKLFSQRMDIVNAVGILFHIIDDEKWKNAITNISNLLKKGGVLFIGDEFSSKTYEKGVWRKFRSLNQYKNQLKISGFKIQKVHRFDWKFGANNDGIRDNLLVGIKE